MVEFMTVILVSEMFRVYTYRHLPLMIATMRAYDFLGWGKLAFV